MANLWGALQSTITNTKKTWKALTFTMLDEGEATERHALDVVQRDSDGNALGTPDKTVTTIIDNATFSETITSADIDVSTARHGILTIKTGTATTSPTLTVALQVKDSNGNYVTHTTLTAVSTATTTFEEFFYLSASTIRFVCTFGGSGNFAATTVEYTTMN